METKTEIPSVPTINPSLDDITGLKNLAGWIARYKNFGLEIDEVSPFVSELLENGTLARFESSLTGLKAGHAGGEEEYERYEFDAKVYNFIDFGDNWVILHFSFLSNRCMMYIECCNQSKFDKISPALENIFNAIGVDPLLEDEYSRDLTWQEADEIILKYLKYIKNPDIQSVPE